MAGREKGAIMVDQTIVLYRPADDIGAFTPTEVTMNVDIIQPSFRHHFFDLPIIVHYWYLKRVRHQPMARYEQHDLEAVDAGGMVKLAQEYRAIYDVPPDLVKAFRERFYSVLLETLQ